MPNSAMPNSAMPNSAMPRRVAFTVEVNLDPLPGTFHTPESVRRNLQAILNDHIPHYDPYVIASNVEEVLPPYEAEVD